MLTAVLCCPRWVSTRTPGPEQHDDLLLRGHTVQSCSSLATFPTRTIKSTNKILTLFIPQKLCFSLKKKTKRQKNIRMPDGNSTSIGFQLRGGQKWTKLAETMREHLAVFPTHFMPHFCQILLLHLPLLLLCKLTFFHLHVVLWHITWWNGCSFSIWPAKTSTDNTRRRTFLPYRTHTVSKVLWIKPHSARESTSDSLSTSRVPAQRKL